MFIPDNIGISSKMGQKERAKDTLGEFSIRFGSEEDPWRSLAFEGKLSLRKRRLRIPAIRQSSTWE